MNQRLFDLAQRMLSPVMEEREIEFEKSLQRLANEMAVKNKLGSGIVYHRVREICEAEIDIRVRSVWHTHARLFSETRTPLADDDVKHLKALIDTEASETCVAMADRLNKTMERLGPREPVSLDDVGRRISEKLHAEVDLAHILSERAEETGTALNFYSSVGVVQTGAVASSTVNMGIPPETAAILEKALKELEDRLDDSFSHAGIPAEQISELLKDIRSEVEKDKPNQLKIRGSLTSLATTVQVAASLQPAYQMIKAAAAQFGITLP